MFEPVSQRHYDVLDSNLQVLVCVLSGDVALSDWAARACAVARLEEDGLLDFVRDLLANPQIRAVVLLGESPAGDVLQRFWRRETALDSNIQGEHLDLLRTYVDLFDGDCGIRKPMRPWWPVRLKYEKEKT